MYKRDPSRYNPNARIYTRQHDIERVMAKISQEKLNNDDILISADAISQVNDVIIDWSSLPDHIHPKVALPTKRLDKKCQQLESLISAILSLHPSEGDVIVDFCSGGGHLAIILAYLLPQVTIYLVRKY